MIDRNSATGLFGLDASASSSDSKFTHRKRASVRHAERMKTTSETPSVHRPNEVFMRIVAAILGHNSLEVKWL